MHTEMHAGKSALWWYPACIATWSFSFKCHHCWDPYAD